jgi:hypothetical protein
VKHLEAVRMVFGATTNGKNRKEVFIPLLRVRRGGRDLKKNIAKPPFWERTGWLVQLPINRWLEPTTPSARAKVASRNLLDRAATPPSLRRGISPSSRCGPRWATVPLEGGEYAYFDLFRYSCNPNTVCCVYREALFGTHSQETTR